MKVKKAIIPAAGLGTRVLPASKAVPKEMLNIVDKPAIQYLVEEAVAAGIEDILIITNRGKGVIEDHFDHSFELEANLAGKKNKEKIYEEVKAVANLANIYFIRQKETAQLCRAYEKYGKGVVGVKEVPDELISMYCSLDVTPLEGRAMSCHKIIEKPTPEQVMSNYAILGRVVLPPEVFGMLEKGLTTVKPGEELYLTDVMSELGARGDLVAYDFDGIRYDMGNKLGIMKANCEVALKHPEIGESFKAYLKELVKTLD